MKDSQFRKNGEKMENKNIGIYIPSYKRADTITTHNLLEYYKVIVRKSEEKQYLQVIPKENLIAVEDEKINDIKKVMKWIIENAEEQVIVTIDDDMKDVIYRLDTNEKVTDKEVVTSEIERIAQLLVDLKLGYGAVDASPTPWNYSAEFEFKGTTGGLRWINKECFKAKIDDEIGYCFDTDLLLQEVLKNRIVLKPKYLCSHGGTDTNKGGNSEKSRKDMLNSFQLMKRKWGKYFHYNLKKNTINILVKR